MRWTWSSQATAISEGGVSDARFGPVVLDQQEAVLLLGRLIGNEVQFAVESGGGLPARLVPVQLGRTAVVHRVLREFFEPFFARVSYLGKQYASNTLFFRRFSAVLAAHKVFNYSSFRETDAEDADACPGINNALSRYTALGSEEKTIDRAHNHTIEALESR